MSYRARIIDHVSLLASPSEQLRYEKEVPIADVPGELVCGFCDDLYNPKDAAFISEFSEEELKDLAHLYGLLVEASRIEVSSVAELQKAAPWRAVIGAAKNLTGRFG